MSFEQHARRRIGLQSDYELQRFTNGFGISDSGLAESPLSDQQLQQMAEEELAYRFEQMEPLMDDDL
jgi:hypothetical protein